ncbi:hypothetical protein F4811DRAFT_509994 [Daldinia bambusicola]|nr:hypothetical protein F4811DRAFT_509994 [Daldinia bambusicola]
MAEYAAAAITAITASAAIVSSSTAHRQQIYRGYNAIENPPWQRRPPFTSTSLRRASAYYDYGQPLYYPSGLHEHLVHHAECPASQCHYRAFVRISPSLLSAHTHTHNAPFSTTSHLLPNHLPPQPTHLRHSILTPPPRP